MVPGQGQADRVFDATFDGHDLQQGMVQELFRISADDFAIVMPGTSVAGAKIVADRCSAHLKEARMFDGTLTAAWGIVEADDETAEGLNTRALAALNADRAAQRG